MGSSNMRLRRTPANLNASSHACSRFSQVWGVEDVILTDGLLRFASLHRARAMTFLDVRSLSRDQLIRVASGFPGTWWQIRKVRLPARRPARPSQIGLAA